MTDWDLKLLRMVAEEASSAVGSHPRWITEDEHLRAATFRLEWERLLTPETVGALLEPIFRARLPSDERARLVALLEAGDGEQVSSVLRAVFKRYLEDRGLKLPPAAE